MDQRINGVGEAEALLALLDANNNEDNDKSSVDSGNTNDAGDDEDESSIDSNFLYYEPMTFNEKIFDQLKSNHRLGS